MVYRIDDLSLAEVYKDMMTKLAKKLVCETSGYYIRENHFSIHYLPIGKLITMNYREGSGSFSMKFNKHKRAKARLSVKGVIGRQEANKLVYKGFKNLYEKILLNS